MKKEEEKTEEEEIVENLIDSFKREKLDTKVKNEIAKEIEESASNKSIEYFYSDNYRGDRYTISFSIEKSKNGELAFGNGRLIKDAS